MALLQDNFEGLIQKGLKHIQFPSNLYGKFSFFMNKLRQTVFPKYFFIIPLNFSRAIEILVIPSFCNWLIEKKYCITSQNQFQSQHHLQSSKVFLFFLGRSYLIMFSSTFHMKQMLQLIVSVSERPRIKILRCHIRAGNLL